MSILRAVLAAALVLPAARAPEAAQLVMIEQPGCAYCAAWMEDVAPEYPLTDEGRFAPLVTVQKRDAPPEGMSFARPVVFTPTFVLVEDGQELARIEGYPGEDFFWGLLARMLEEHTDYDPDAEEGGGT
ncbi:thioredoxin family protein [Rhodosalinus halophilus]|uniref:Thioredoxin family protein n=1 Tax=Rhodosalinus halophilus TaxID=2259333 RepID=A0A365U652_9RHOB|nr:thioredoxin fold domain-containing protein [Rhodosalinus halophilus]RBI82772.1 thioredoxin family protein [Rhodosalinus halophilus]